MRIPSLFRRLLPALLLPSVASVAPSEAQANPGAVTYGTTGTARTTTWPRCCSSWRRA